MITSDRLNQIMDLWDYCFEKKDDPFFKWYFKEYCLKNNMVVGGFEEKTDNLLNMLHINPYKLNLRGREELVPYIVGVATSPEARGEHLTRGLLETAFEILRAEKITFVLLKPIFAGIYMPYEFSFCYNKHLYDLPLTKLAGTDIPANISIRHYADYSSNLFSEMYQNFSRVYHAMPIRTQFQWDKLLSVHKMEHVHAAVAYDNNRPVAYMFYEIKDDKTFFVQELISINSLGKKSLLAYAASHLSDARNFYWEADEQDLTYLDFKDADCSGSILPFMMGRCIDAYRALKDYKLPSNMPDCDLTAILTDNLIKLNNHLLSIKIRNGRLSVERIMEIGNEDVVMNMAVFSQLYFGAYTASQLFRAGKIEAKDENVLAVLDLLFPKCYNFINEYF